MVNNSKLCIGTTSLWHFVDFSNADENRIDEAATKMESAEVSFQASPEAHDAKNACSVCVKQGSGSSEEEADSLRFPSVFAPQTQACRTMRLETYNY